MTISAQNLMQIIHIQNELAKLGPDLGQLMDKAAHKAMWLLEASGAVIEIRDNDTMVYRAACGIAQKSLGLKIKIKGSLSGAVVLSNKSLSTANAMLDDRTNKKACQSMGITSMLIVPLTHCGDVVGVLKVVSNQENFFTQKDEVLLGLLSESVASHIHYASVNTALDWKYKATHDNLTGLPNRAAFFEDIQSFINNKQSFAVMMVDMDNLKTINDNFGHIAGDAVLKELSNKLLSLPSNTKSFRLGGDEFALLSQIQSDQSIPINLLSEQVKGLEGNIFWEGNVLPLGLSVGGVVYSPSTPQPIETILHLADQKMYEDKKTKN